MRFAHQHGVYHCLFHCINMSFDTERHRLVHKNRNDLFSPMSQNVNDQILTYHQEDKFEFHVQTGSKLYPGYPFRSHSGAYYKLKKTLGVHRRA